MFEDFDFAKAEVFFIFPVVSQVNELAGMTLVFVAIEQGLLVLKRTYDYNTM